MFVIATLLFTLFLSGRRLRMSVTHNRPLWALLTLALIAQLAAFGLLLADSWVNPEGTLVAFDPTLYFCLNSLLLTIAAVYSPIGPLRRWASIMDGLLALAIAGLFYALLHRLIGAGTSNVSVASFLIWMFDAMALFVAACATLRFAATKRADERRFYFVLLIFAWTELIFPAIHNRFVLTSESYVPELFIDLPFVVLGLLLSRRRTVWVRWYRPSRRARVVVGSISPFVLSLALCLLAFVQFGHNAGLAIVALVLGITSYAVRVAVMLGHHLYMESELKHLQRGLKQRIIHDDLTRLLNRRGFYRTFQREWERASTLSLPLAVAMVDIDMFKAFNDTYGHLAGDDCLAAVARALQKETSLHAGVTVARYGGEEFAVLFSGRDRMAVEHVLQRLRSRVEALQIQNRRSPYGVVTASAGVAARGDGEHAGKEKLLDAADKALYAAKHAGRNCIRWFVPDISLVEFGKHG
ncbi:GGDEF domain-containing protein [Dyella nitratireducens]|uniref:GGDEF domain-containing protein n=1 Tax=Dyella nitratireducens TaxID=1849580 RepID=UPI0016692F1D|nr:diguanylate cyclase [Dyella nitratireducens]